MSTLDPDVVLTEIYANFQYVLRFSYKDLIPGLTEEVERHPERLEAVYDTGGEPHITIYRVHGDWQGGG
jgi:hypothetical protein